MALQTINIADKPTLDEIKALLENSGYGLEAIKNMIGSSTSGMVCKEESDIASETILDGYSKYDEIAITLNSDTGYGIHLQSDGRDTIYWFTWHESNSSANTFVQQINSHGTGNFYLNPGIITGTDNKSRIARSIVIGNKIHIFYYCDYSSSVGYYHTIINTDTHSVESYIKTSYEYIGYVTLFEHEGDLYLLNSDSGYIKKWNEGDSWTKIISSMPYKLNISYPPAIVSYKGHIHLIGGDKTQFKMHYKLVDGNWVKEPDLKYIIPYYKETDNIRDLTPMTAVVYNDLLYISLRWTWSSGGNPAGSQGHSNHNVIIYNGEHYLVDIKKSSGVAHLGQFFNNRPIFIDAYNFYPSGDIYYLKTGIEIDKRRIVLPKNKRIFLDTTYGMKYVIPYTNCKIEDDHLVVLENGVVEFGIQAFDTLKRISCF